MSLKPFCKITAELSNVQETVALGEGQNHSVNRTTRLILVNWFDCDISSKSGTRTDTRRATKKSNLCVPGQWPRKLYVY